MFNSTDAIVGMTDLPYGTYSVAATYLLYDVQYQTVILNSPAQPVNFAFVTAKVNQIYNTAGTYTYEVPDNVPYLNFTVIGGGGGAGGICIESTGSGNVPSNYVGGGGGSGYVVTGNVSVKPGQMITVIVGAGGACGSNGYVPAAGGTGGTGGASSFGSISANGGNGGKGSTMTAGGEGGQGQNRGNNGGLFIGANPDYNNGKGGAGYGTNGYGAGGSGNSGSSGAVLIWN